MAILVNNIVFVNELKHYETTLISFTNLATFTTHYHCRDT